MSDTARDVLRVLADLSPQPADGRSSELRIPTEWFRWLPLRYQALMTDRRNPAMPWLPKRKLVERVASAAVLATDLPSYPLERELADRLAALEQVRKEVRPLRVGWLFLAGRMPDGSRVFVPLVSRSVRVLRGAGPLPGQLQAAGDTRVLDALTPVDDPRTLHRWLVAAPRTLHHVDNIAARTRDRQSLVNQRVFARQAVHAAFGVLPDEELARADASPQELMARDRLVVVAGVGLYAVEQTESASHVASLRAWADTGLETPTALHAVYLPDSAPPTAPDTSSVHSPYLLTGDQRAAVRSSRTERVTVVSGAPGTGKSHTVAAIACDALSRGQTVLVAAKAPAAVDALLGLFSRAPGPEPVAFGSADRAADLTAWLGATWLDPASARQVELARAAYDRAVLEVDRRHDEVIRRLAAELLLDEAPPGLARAQRRAPWLFAPGARILEVQAALAAGRGDTWTDYRLRLALALPPEKRVDDLVDVVRESLPWALELRAAQEVPMAGGLTLVEDLALLRAAHARLREALGTWQSRDSRSAARFDKRGRDAVDVLADALNAGRATRREMLAAQGTRLTQALPLWAGTFDDIDDLLPATPALFDLVILDEASSLDQATAATALVRARRAVVVGDPRQLRHLSFVSEAQRAAAVAAHGIDDPFVAGRLDVRRFSAFDVAASVAPTRVLTEHFRSAPHLIDFVAERLYGGTVRVATRKPSTDRTRCVEVVRLVGQRDERGVVPGEVLQVIARLHGLLLEGVSSVGVVTPFRKQADALERAALAAFSANALQEMDLRIGTVHGFQGNERDVVLVSTGVGRGAAAGTWRFVEDPALMAVLLTRARQRMVVFLSSDPPERGLFADYLASVSAPPAAPPLLPVTPWAASVAAEVRRWVPVREGYATGNHVLDLVGPGDTAVELDVHPDGPVAHVERHLALLERGWRVLDGYPSRWSSRRDALVQELVSKLRAPEA